MPRPRVPSTPDDNSTSDRASGYQEVASAAGAWARDVEMPPTTFTEIREALVRFVAAHRVPISGFAHGVGELVSTITMIRDPSITFGTPPIADCQNAATELARANGWTTTADRPKRGLLIGLGLREGYDPAALVHHPAEARARLRGLVTGWTATPARLVSARPVDHDGVRWHDELGIIISGAPHLLPAVIQLAAEFKQRRFAVTDFHAHRTFALRT